MFRARLPQLRRATSRSSATTRSPRAASRASAGSSSATPTAGARAVVQQSTYQPDTTWRWMGSAAMDAPAIWRSASARPAAPSTRRSATPAAWPSDPPEHARPGRGDPLRRHGQPDRHRQPLGRLQRHDRRPRRRLHLLVHERILPDQRLVQLAHAHRQLQVPDLRDLGGAARQRRQDGRLRQRSSGQPDRLQRHADQLRPERRHRRDLHRRPARGNRRQLDDRRSQQRSRVVGHRLAAEPAPRLRLLDPRRADREACSRRQQYDDE